MLAYDSIADFCPSVAFQKRRLPTDTCVRQIPVIEEFFPYSFFKKKKIIIFRFGIRFISRSEVVKPKIKRVYLNLAIFIIYKEFRDVPTAHTEFTIKKRYF